MHRRHPDTGRIDPDYYERSPSTGAEETAGILSARDGYDHDPPTCDRCDRDGEPIAVFDETRVRRAGVRCSVHAKDFLEIST